MVRNFFKKIIKRIGAVVKMNNKSTSKILLTLIIIMVVVYTAAEFCLQYYTHTEVNDTLTTAWFAFWGTEIISLAAIKTSKVKHGYKKSDNSDNYDEESNEESNEGSGEEYADPGIDEDLDEDFTSEEE